jgi:U3 small nucleolar RNA-associated protein 20
LKEIAEKHCAQLKSPHLSSGLGLQIVKNLFYIGKCFCAAEASSSQPTEDVESENSDEGDTGEQEGEHNEETSSDNPLAWLFSKLSFQIRSAYISRRSRSSSSVSALAFGWVAQLTMRQDNWHEQPAAILRFFAAMANYMEASLLEGFLMHILSPIYRITEDDSIRDQRMGEYLQS